MLTFLPLNDVTVEFIFLKFIPKSSHKEVNADTQWDDSMLSGSNLFEDFDFVISLNGINEINLDRGLKKQLKKKYPYQHMHLTGGA